MTRADHHGGASRRAGWLAILGVWLGGVPAVTDAQNCNPATVPTAPDSRYELRNAGKEVYDKATGLTWQRCVDGQSWNGRECAGTRKLHAWPSALQLAQDSGGIWRLPNVKELLSLAEMSCEPAVNLRVFPWVPEPRTLAGYALWSSAASSDPWEAYAVYGWRVHAFQTGSAVAHVRLVK